MMVKTEKDVNVVFKNKHPEYRMFGWSIEIYRVKDIFLVRK